MRSIVLRVAIVATLGAGCGSGAPQTPKSEKIDAKTCNQAYLDKLEVKVGAVMERGVLERIGEPHSFRLDCTGPANALVENCDSFAHFTLRQAGAEKDVITFSYVEGAQTLRLKWTAAGKAMTAEFANQTEVDKMLGDEKIRVGAANVTDVATERVPATPYRTYFVSYRLPNDPAAPAGIRLKWYGPKGRGVDALNEDIESLRASGLLASPGPALPPMYSIDVRCPIS